MLAAGQQQHPQLPTGEDQRQHQAPGGAFVRVGGGLLGVSVAQHPLQAGLQRFGQGLAAGAAQRVQALVAVAVWLQLQEVGAGKVGQGENLFQQVLQPVAEVILLDVVRLGAADDLQQAAIALAALTLRIDGLSVLGHLPPGGVATVEQQQGEQGYGDQPG